MDNLQESERLAFEAWEAPTAIEKSVRTGEYYNSHTTARWEGWKARAALAQRAASVPDAGDEPFMCVIMGPDGKAHMDENCVSDDIDIVEYEVDNLNEAQDGGYSVVPLYTRPQPVSAVLTPGKINVIADDLSLWEALPKEWGSPKKEGMIQGFARAVLAAAGKGGAA